MLTVSEQEEGSAVDPAFRASVKRCAERLRHAATLAVIAAGGTEPEHGAQYLLDTIDDLAAELRALRAALQQAN